MAVVPKIRGVLLWVTFLLGCCSLSPLTVEARRRKLQKTVRSSATHGEELERAFQLWQPASDGDTLGSEFTIHQLSSTPSVYRVDNFFDAAACERLISLALDSPTLAESEVNWKAESDLREGNGAWRHSTSAFLPKEGKAVDPTVAALSAKVSRLTRVPEAVLSRGNSLQIARYRPGEHYWPHFDSRHLKDLGAEAFIKLLEAGGGGAARLTNAMLSAQGFPYAARYATVLLFLRAPAEGGNTSFPLVSATAVEEPTGPVEKQLDSLSSKNTHAHKIWRQHSAQCEHGLTVTPQQGSALLFYNHKLSADGRLGELDRLTFHGGCDVLAGEKWVANYWVELPPSFFCDECSDGGGGEVETMSVEYDQATGVRLRGKKPP
jgi:hypothetical protein|eukprot:COSAG03_NODE_139_length_11780_cov_2.736153_3_plen_378_part_00